MARFTHLMAINCHEIFIAFFNCPTIFNQNPCVFATHSHAKTKCVFGALLSADWLNHWGGAVGGGTVFASRTNCKRGNHYRIMGVDNGRATFGWQVMWSGIQSV